MQNDVYLNLYEYTSCGLLEALGLAAYHSSVEYNNVQYNYIVGSENPSCTGLVKLPPGTGGSILLHRLYMGKSHLTPQQFAVMYKQLEEKYTNGRYHLFKNNCNHFSDEMLYVLVGRRVPKWVVRLTKWLRMFSGLVPRGVVNAQRALAEQRRKTLEAMIVQEQSSYFGYQGHYELLYSN